MGHINERTEFQDLKYPYIYCAHHNKTAPGYMICNHIRSAKDVAHLEIATETELGIAVCAACAAYAKSSDDEEFMMANFTMSCADGLRELGILGDDNGRAN